MSQSPLSLILRDGPDVARGVRNLIRKTSDGVFHGYHLFLQTSEGIVIFAARRRVGWARLGWWFSCHMFLRNALYFIETPVRGARFRARPIQPSSSPYSRCFRIRATIKR